MLTRLGHAVALDRDAAELRLNAVVADAAWALFDRAVCAHMRGDDRVTLQTSTRVLALRDALLREAAPDAGGAPPEARALDFAEPAGALARDSARRIARGPRAPSVLPGDTSDGGAVRATRDASVEDRIALAPPSSPVHGPSEAVAEFTEGSPRRRTGASVGEGNRVPGLELVGDGTGPERSDPASLA